MLDIYDQELLTAVVQRAETTGKEVKPLIVPTDGRRERSRNQVVHERLFFYGDMFEGGYGC